MYRLNANKDIIVVGLCVVYELPIYTNHKKNGMNILSRRRVKKRVCLTGRRERNVAKQA